MDDNIAIKVESLSKVFKLPHEKHTSLKSLFVRGFRRKRSFEKQQALDNISFEVKKGEFFGIVGRNGSGKSTLLKLLAGIYAPTSGTVTTVGKLTPFIELGVGFNPELTGRENVFLNGALLGFDRKDMEAMYDEIVSFAELEKFMDQKLKNYSSGMQVRLAFSIAIRAKSDILLIDEVLAVGDMAFQEKCYEHFAALKKSGQTVVLVTHDMSAVRRFCSRALILNDSKKAAIGDPEKITETYDKINNIFNEKLQPKTTQAKTEKEPLTKQYVIAKIETINTATKSKQKIFEKNEKIGVRVRIKVAKDAMPKPVIGLIFQDAKNQETVFATNTASAGLVVVDADKNGFIDLLVTVDNVFTNTKYTITAAVESKDFMTVHDRMFFGASFSVEGFSFAHALTHPSHTMELLNGDTE